MPIARSVVGFGQPFRLTNPTASNPPTLVIASIPISGTSLNLVYSEVVSIGLNGTGGHTLSMSGGAVILNYLGGSGTNTLTYSCSRTISSGESGTLSYTQPGDGIESQTTLVDVVSFSNQSVVNNSTVVSTAGSLSTTFTLTSTSSGTKPFTIGHVFKQGDVPAGKIPIGDISDWQARILTTWPDGSAKHAIVSGRSNISVGDTVITLSSGTDPGGTALTEADLAAALPANTRIDAGSFQWTLNSSIGTADLKRTVCSGPVMSNFIYRKSVTGNNHLVLWADVRVYKGGNVEIFPWVENAYLTVANPTNDIRTYSVVIGGATRFTQSLDIKHHTRIPLMTGTSFSYWTGADPTITPKHNTTYLMSTKLVPNYIPGLDAGAYGLHTETYTPNWIGDTKAGMASPGYGDFIGLLPAWAAIYLAGGADPRAYRYVVANGLAAGAWSIHYRNEVTNEPPTYIEFPNISIDWPGTPILPNETGPVNQSAGINAVWDCAHHPSLAYLPWLLTARWFFLDEQLFWDFRNYNYMKPAADTRNGAEFLFFGGQIRARGWCMRTQSQALSSLPSNHPSYVAMKASWEANMTAYKATFIDGTRNGGVDKNVIGLMGVYGSNNVSPYGTEGQYWWDAPWMQSIIAMALGSAKDLGLPQSTTATHDTLCNFVYTQAVGRAAPDDGTGWSYRRFAAYSMPVGRFWNESPPSIWGATWKELYDVYEAHDGTGWGPLLPLPSGTGLYYGDAPVDGADFARTSAVAFNWAANVYAAEHNATGAVAAYSRITATANYALAAPEYRLNPTWALSTRAVALPAYLSTKNVLEWTSVTGPGSTSGIAPSGQFGGTQAVVDAWGGATLRQSTGHFILHGGGHGDYSGNEIYACNLASNAPTWSRVWGPTPVGQVTNTPYYADGNPASAHTYYFLHWDETNDRLLRVKGGPGYPSGGTSDEFNSWNWGASNWNPNGTHPDVPGSHTTAPSTARNPLTGDIIMWDYWWRHRYTAASNSWTLQNDTSAPVAMGENASVIDTKRNRFVAFGETTWVNSTTLYLWNLANNAITTTVPSGTTAFEGKLGVAYDPVNDCIWYMGYDSVLRKYDCTTNTCSAVSTTGSGPQSPSAYGNGQPYFGRLQYWAAARAIVVQPAWNSPTFIIRVST